ncbi:MAG: glycosyltransferase [Chloroflexi bacterium]|nr:glycosyltransferase [Chloroflexota bacterium]MBV9547457.1 glycosyltransferase [Chloroflexota bacterium]
MPPALGAQPSPAPSISLTTPTLNQRQFIEFTLESVLSQRYPNLQYTVQDGGSTDGTLELLEDYCNAGELVYRSASDRGLGQAINRGFAGSSGEIMGYLNSDDLLLPGALATIATWFSKHPNVDVVYGNRLLIDQLGFQIGRWILPPHDNQVLYWEDYIPQETLFWRRRMWERVGGRVDESFRFAVDWDLLIRFAEAGARFARIPRCLGAFRIHDAQKTTSQAETVGRQEIERILQRYHGYIPSDCEIDAKVAAFHLRHKFYDLAYARGLAQLF